MIRISQKDFESLKGSTDFDGLHEYLTRISRNGKGDVIWSPSDSTIYIRTEAIGEAFRNLLVEWIRNNNIEVVQVPNDSAPAAAAASASAEDGLARLQREQRAAAAETAKLIEDAANKRVAFYISSEGLMDDDHNRDLVLGFFDRNRCAYTVANVDIAIQQLSSELHWSVWSPRLQPVDTTPLIEGTQETQLPLDASESVMRKANLVQLRDLSRRKKEGQGHRQGSFGSSFIESTF